jgi:hypothetical protein
MRQFQSLKSEQPNIVAFDTERSGGDSETGNCSEAEFETEIKSWSFMARVISERCDGIQTLCQPTIRMPDDALNFIECIYSTTTYMTIFFLCKVTTTHYLFIFIFVVLIVSLLHQ